MKEAGEPKLTTANVTLNEDNHNGIIENPRKTNHQFCFEKRRKRSGI